MGTRGFYGLCNADHSEIKGSYNHYDSYPTCLGRAIVRDVAKVKPTPHTLKECEQYPANDDKAPRPLVERVHAITGGTDGGLGPDRAHGYYGLMRDLQGELAKNVQARAFCGDAEFMRESLFCEWAYLYNVDTRKLEVYRGFNQNRDAVPAWQRVKPDCDGYYACRLVGEISLEECARIAALPEVEQDAFYTKLENIADAEQAA